MGRMKIADGVWVMIVFLYAYFPDDVTLLEFFTFLKQIVYFNNIFY